MARLLSKTFYSLCEAAEQIGQHLFPDEWTGGEAEARDLPPRDDAARLLEERSQLKKAAAEAGVRGRPPYDLLDPPPPPPNSGGGAGMGEPDTPLNRLRRRLLHTEWIEHWPEVGSPKYETERAAYARWVEAEAELIEALREGHLTAVVRRTNGSRYGLTPAQWRSRFNRFCVKTSCFGSRASSSLPFYDEHCEVSAASLRTLLGSNEAIEREYRTGFPGRPSLRDAVKRVAEERALNGTAKETLAAEAEVLAQEIKRLYPEAPNHPTARTIETHVREVRRRLCNRNTK